MNAKRPYNDGRRKIGIRHGTRPNPNLIRDKESRRSASV